MKCIALIFPNQLFEQSSLLKLPIDHVVLLEDSLYFGDVHYPCKFHKQKLAYHRATMRAYERFLLAKELSVEYVTYKKNTSLLFHVMKKLASRGAKKVYIYEPVDFILQKRIFKFAQQFKLEFKVMPNPGFLNTPEINQEWYKNKKRYLMADFYQFQRKRLDVLMNGDKPEGGQWSFDKENRKKLPKKFIGQLPQLPQINNTQNELEAIVSIRKEFKRHPGELQELLYPITHDQAKHWLKIFLRERLENFGPYEDAIEADEHSLFHSVLTPALNTGLLTPGYIVKETLKFANANIIPLNSLEGFIRQIIGWREFMRLTYHNLGVSMRTQNHWQHTRPIPKVFYTAQTNIEPVDDAIRKVLRTGYCHHIERLMVLGGFMFICEIEPNQIYKWFMEMFIDSYDWVMVPNVYAMSQHADGGLITSKPYFSGSNYILKMSHYEKGPWCEIWDGLFWRWIINNKKDLQKNPRWSMICKQAENMEHSKQKRYVDVAENYLQHLN